ncbi:MAG: hypothetical protein JOY66_21410 [Acetobacteraceae bacterium]|nr:hypothetical protein [Acetobacteraceae bacterium]
MDGEQTAQAATAQGFRQKARSASDKPDDPSALLLQALLLLLGVAYPLAIAVAAYLSVEQGWPWYESAGAGLGTLWITSIPCLWCPIITRRE